MDCYGDPKVTGKVGTDIEDNKCSWLVVQALAIANDEQRTLLEVSYYSMPVYTHGLQASLSTTVYIAIVLQFARDCYVHPVCT